MNDRSSIFYSETLHLPVESYILNNLLFAHVNSEKVADLRKHTAPSGGGIGPGEAAVLFSERKVSGPEDTESWLNTESELFEHLTSDLSAILFTLDRRRRLVWWNRQFEIITRYSKKELTRLPLNKLFPPSERKKAEESVGKALTEGSTEFYSWPLTKNARRIPFHFKINSTDSEEEPHAIGLGFEISAAEKAIRESEQYRKLLEAIIKQANALIFVKDNEGKYVMANSRFREVMGLGNRQVIGKTDFDLFDEAFAQMYRKDDLRVIEQQKPKKSEERFNTENGTRYYLTSKFSLSGIPGLERGICGIATEITKFKEKEFRVRKQQKTIAYLATKVAFSEATLDEKLNTITRRSATTLNVSRVHIWLLENDKLRCINSYNAGVFNSMKGEVMDMNAYPDFLQVIKSSRVISISDAQNDHRSRELAEHYLAPNNIQSLLHTSVHISKAVTLLVCHESVKEKRKWKQDEIAFAGAIADQVAQALAKEEREAKEQEIRESLQEKEVLLSEVHHRVKNNLAVVSSMMQLQTFEETNEEVKNKLLDSVTRIKAMATIHELLYQSQSFTKIEFTENIQRLVKNIINIHQPAIPIDLDFDLPALHLNMSQAIPCSLIVNEIVTNILKHAFKGRTEGKIQFNLSRDETDNIRLIVKDNGIGLPEHFDPAGHKTLGMVLIDVLAQQLEAEYEFVSDNGSEFRLWFKKE